MYPNFTPKGRPTILFGLLALLALIIAGCGGAPSTDNSDSVSDSDSDSAAVEETAAVAAGQELPVRPIPNVPSNAEAYYAPNNSYVIAQTQDPLALKAEGRHSGSLTYTFTDTGEDIKRINDHGQDACSYFFPDGKRLVYTSTRDNMDMPIGNWSDSSDYPQGAELYIADLKDGGNVIRLTNNEFYDAEVSVSPDGSKIIFTRQIDGMLDIWMMNSDGTDEHQISFTPEWQEGAPFFLPDNKTITMRAWKRKDPNAEDTGHSMTLMTVFTVDTDTKVITPITTDEWMNWAPYPTPDGKHYVFVRPLVDNPRNWEVFLGNIDGSAPVRLTYNDSFDGFPSVSPDGTKMLFTRSVGDGFMSDLYTYVMDISSLNVGSAH